MEKIKAYDLRQDPFIDVPTYIFHTTAKIPANQLHEVERAIEKGIRARGRKENWGYFLMAMVIILFISGILYCLYRITVNP